MAGRRTVDYSVLIKREGERLLQCLKDPNLEIISYVGWEGMGRWRITEYATNIAMETHPFDFLIWVYLPRDEESSRWKLQMSIAKSLGILSPTMNVKVSSFEESEIDMDIAAQIYEKLKAKKFLLVLGGASWEYDHVDLEGLGIPIVSRWFASVSKVVSKVVLVGKWSNINNDQELNLVVDIALGSPSISDAWDFFCEEAALIAHSPSTKGYFCPSTVMNFLLYFSLIFDNQYYCFSSDTEWLIRYFVAEEFISMEMEEDEVLFETMNALLTEFRNRSILHHAADFVVWGKRNALIEILKSGFSGGVPIFCRRFWIERDSLPEEDDDEHGWESIQRMSFLNTGQIGINLPLTPKCHNLSTLILRYESDHIEFPQNFFDHMVSLRVLDLAYTPIKTLPSSLSSLCNLKLLMLRSCKKVVSLPTSFRALKKLEFLDLSECDSLKVIPEESFELMDRLRVLDLSKTQIHSLPSSIGNLHNLEHLFLCTCTALTHIPEKCLERMSRLRVLSLYEAISLKSLPSSSSNLVNLKKLYLSHCSSLETGVWPQPLQSLSSLEELDLSFCNKLKDIREASFQDMLPKLRLVNISNTKAPNCLSFRGCQSIEILRLFSLENLEVLDLSGTKLETLDLHSLKNYSLKRLDILPIGYCDVLFEELHLSDDNVGARIWVSDPQFFQSTLEYDSGFFEAPCFSRFYIRISPYQGGGEVCKQMTMDKIQNIHLKRVPFVYKGICSSHTQTHLFPHFKSRGAYCRHVEVCGGNSSPLDVHVFLTHTELITLYDNNVVESLTNLCSDAQLMDLRECRVGNCQRIKNIIFGDSRHSDILEFLELIWASDLPQLTVMCGGVYGVKSFALLKHVCLQCCPKLVTLFTSGVYLYSLETLEIRFCCRLENVFEEEVSGGESSLQSLSKLCLLHLPKLKSVCNGSLPQLQKVRVGKCPKLRKLPFRVCLVDRSVGGLDSRSSSLPMVEIAGEMEWWKNLEWGNEDDSIKMRPALFRPMRHASTTM
ncbi:hypothetical protein AAC387_Pa06g3111 [Persea americana]